MNITYSFVIPIYNEIDNLAELYRRTRAVAEGLGDPWEIVLVDDGSTDGSTERIRQLARSDARVRAVVLARTFGHALAIAAGWDYSRGDAVIVIDGDLQDPPEVIPELVKKWKEGFEVVYGVRRRRKGETWFKKASAACFYRILHRITDVKIPMDVGEFRLIDRKVVTVLKSMRERHRFPRGMSAWVGFRQIGVEYDRTARAAGVSKYAPGAMARLAWSALTGFSHAPLKLATLLGTISVLASLLAIPALLVVRSAGARALGGQAVTLIAVFFLGGVQLISIGILGEYVGRLSDEAKGRPLYVVREAPQD